MAHSLDMPTLARSPAKAHELLLPTVAVSGPRYGALVAGLYWVMLALLMAVYACTLVGYALPAGSDGQEAFKQLHFTLGLGIFALFCLRLVIRLVDNEPPMQPPLVEWQARTAKALQWGLYLFMLAMPLAGWMLMNALGKPVAFYGLELPVLLAPDRELASTLRDFHELGAMLGYLLIGLNIVAALHQHHAPHDRLPPPRALPNLR